MAAQSCSETSRRNTGSTKRVARHGIVIGLGEGFATLEELLRRRKRATTFGYDEKPTVGDIYLVPQIYNAGRAGVDMSAYPLESELDGRCRALPEFDKVMPQKQIYFPEET